MRYPLFAYTAILAFLVIPFVSYGQKGVEDVVYLKNGSIMYGTIIENIPNDHLTIKTDDGDVLTNAWSEIYKISKEYPYQTKKADTVFPASGTTRSGYLNIVQLSGGTDFSKPRGCFGVNDINAYRISPEFSAGLGVGLDQVDSTSITFSPIFADFRFYTLGDKKNGIIVFDIGKSFCLTSNNSGGLMISFSFNERIPLSNKTAITIGIAYTYQYEIAYSYAVVWGYYEPIATAGQIDYLRLNFGFSFE